MTRRVRRVTGWSFVVLALPAVLASCGAKHSSGTSSTTTPRRGVVAALGARIPTNRGSIVAYSYDSAAAATTGVTRSDGLVAVAVDVEGCAGTKAQGTGLAVQRFHLQIGRRAYLPIAPVREPALHDIQLNDGQCSRGWVSFAIPPGVTPDFIVFQGTQVVSWRIRSPQVTTTT